MKKEYDFTKAERGKFFHKGAQLRLPIYLEIKLQTRVQKIAQEKHKDLQEIVNNFVRKEVALTRH